jgi:hypothetical protein
VVAFCSPLFWVDLRPGRVESRTLQVLAHAGQVRISERGAQLRLQLHQQVSAPWGPFLTLTPGRSCPPGVNFVPSGRSYPLGVKFSVRPSSLLNSRDCSPLGVNIPPRGQISPLGATGEVKNVPQQPLVPLLLLGPPFIPIIYFVSTTLLTGMTSISLHMQWTLTSQSNGSFLIENIFLLGIKLHAPKTSYVILSTTDLTIEDSFCEKDSLYEYVHL